MDSGESIDVQEVFDFCRGGPARKRKTARLVFALMPDDESAAHLARFTESLLAENALAAVPVKAARLHIALHRLAARPSALYGAKLAGQAVAAAGLRLRFHGLGSVGRGLALTSADPALAALQETLSAALARNGLHAAPPAPPHLTLAHGAGRRPLQAIAPLTVTLAGLALLRREGSDPRGEAMVLRRWPLNRLGAIA